MTDVPPTFPPTPDDAYDDEALERARAAVHAMPDYVGRYRILELLGHGGMGEVYVAEQTTPIKRRVALKLIKTGMDTRQVVARFEAERQALAMMDHPNIARVFDAGTTDTGRPYFVMELVRGVPVTQFCDDNKLTTRQRVELLVPVCQAVQHAHQKGIIHRDLKPTNVLVTLHDGKAVPKVIDFGIAKATGQSLTDKTVYTEFRQMIGTPAYMSPEQAEMSGIDIDTRSDVYSLGVLAYELLTGSTPFDTRRLIEAGLAEIGRIIKEEEPPKPSSRLSTLGERLTTVAGQRSTDAGRIGKLVAGELDWIVMKAMEKDRRRRYETASGLAADLERHLAGEPVVAAPPSWGYRLSKLGRRYRAQLMVAAVIAALLVLGTVLSTALAVRARRAETAAAAQRDEAKRQETVARQERDAATAANRRAEASEKRAVDTAESATRQTHYVSAQYQFGQGRLGPAYGEIAAAIASRPHLEYGHLLTQIVDAARANWVPVAHVGDAVGANARACFVGDAATLAVADDRELRLLDVRTGSVARRIAMPRPADLLAVCGDGVVVARGREIAVYPAAPPAADVAAVPATATLDDAVTSVAASPDGRLLAATFGRGQAVVLDLATMKVTARHTFKSSGRMSSAFSSNHQNAIFSTAGERVLYNSGFWVDDVSVWDFRSDTAVQRKLNRPNIVCYLDNSTALSMWRSDSSSTQMTLSLTDLATGQETGADYDSRASDNMSAWVPAKRGTASPLAAATSADSIDLFSLSDHTVICSDRFDSLTPANSGPSRFLGFDGSAGLLALATDGGVTVFQSTRVGPAADDGSKARSARETRFWCMDASAANVFVVPEMSTIRRIPWADGRVEDIPFARPAFDGSREWHPWGLSVAPDGRTAAVLMQENSGGGNIDAQFFRKAVVLYDLTRPERPLPPVRFFFLSHYDGVNGRSNRLLVLSPDARTVAFVPSNGDTTIYRVEDGSEVAQYRGGLTSCVSPDHTLIGGGNPYRDGPVEVWNAADGREVFKAPLGGVTQTLAISGDDKRVYVGWSTGTLECFDIATGKSLSRVASRLSPVAVSPSDDRFLGFLTDKGTNGSLLVGDLKNGQPVVVLNDGANVSNRAIFSPDGSAVVYIRSRGYIQFVRNAGPGQAREALARTVPLVVASRIDTSDLDTLVAAGDELESKNQSASALAKYLEALPLARQKLPASDAAIARLHLKIVTAQVEQGREVESEPYARDELAIFAGQTPIDETDVAWGQTDLARALAAQARYGEAEPLLRAAMSTRIREDGPFNRRTKITADVLAKVLQATGRPDEASAVRAAHDLPAPATRP